MFFAGGNFAFVLAVDKEKCNKCSNKNYKNANNDPDPNGDSACGGFSASYFKLNKKNGRKGRNVDGGGFCGSAGDELDFNNGAFRSFVSEGRKAGGIFDNKAINAVFFNKSYVVNSGSEIGFGVIKINKLAVGDVIFAGIGSKFGGMCHCENICFIVGNCVCLGSVKAVNNSSVRFAIICHSVNKKGDIKSGKCVAVCNEFCCGFVGNAVTVKGNDAEAGVHANIFFKKEFDFGYGDIAVDAESKADGFKNIFNNGSFDYGRAAFGRNRFGAFRNFGDAGTAGAAYGFRGRNRAGRCGSAAGRSFAGSGAGRSGSAGAAGAAGTAGRTVGSEFLDACASPRSDEINISVRCGNAAACVINISVAVFPTFELMVFEFKGAGSKNKVFVKVVIFFYGVAACVTGIIGYAIGFSGNRTAGTFGTDFGPLCVCVNGDAASAGSVNTSGSADGPFAEGIAVSGEA